MTRTQIIYDDLKRSRSYYGNTRKNIRELSRQDLLSSHLFQTRQSALE